MPDDKTPVQFISTLIDVSEPLCTAIYPVYVPAVFDVSRVIFNVPPVRTFQFEVVTLNADELEL